jgi:acyl-CoA thioesterase-2
VALDPTESLASILSVEHRRDGEYVARLADFGWGDAARGDVLARAVLAAGDDCRERELASAHAWFLRPAPAKARIALHVERLKDGRRFSHRRVQLRFDERLICDATLSFVSPSEGLQYQCARFEPGLPAPEELPGDAELARAEGWPASHLGPVEWRRIGPSWPWPAAAAGESVQFISWVRPRAPLPDDARLHAAGLVFLSDHCSHWGVEKRLGGGFASERFVSLDHAIWVHRPRRWDDWWLMTTASDVSHGGRAFTRREVYTRDGLLVASIAQEALVGAGDGEADDTDPTL